MKQVNKEQFYNSIKIYNVHPYIRRTLHTVLLHIRESIEEIYPGFQEIRWTIK